MSTQLRIVGRVVDITQNEYRAEVYSKPLAAKGPIWIGPFVCELGIATPLIILLAETISRHNIGPPHQLGLVVQSHGTNTEYFVTDGLGLVQQVVGASGSMLLAQTFDPFGNRFILLMMVIALMHLTIKEQGHGV